MARVYRHIKEYEGEILRLKAEGKTKREIGEQLGFTKIQNYMFTSTPLGDIIISVRRKYRNIRLY